jgi:glycerol-3-phosphate dehydrogenase
MMMDDDNKPNHKSYDLLIIGGGINGTAIARDAAGRGLSVLLCEKDDLGNHTSSASTKLIHGGLRYLEYFEFRLVREALIEREVLLRSAPHIIWPLRFILPYEKNLRPAWLLRMGLFLYDHIGGRKLLPPTKTVNVHNSGREGILKSRFKKGFEYSDCWVEDSRFVVMNALDAHEKGAEIGTRAEVRKIEKSGKAYKAEIIHEGKCKSIFAKGVINAAGPWVEEVLFKIKRTENASGLRLVKGSHIVTDRLFDGDHAYIFQNADKRIIFAIPYEKDYTLIGTTDQPHHDGTGQAKISPEEISYLCSAASEYFKKEISKDDVVWTYSGIRPLYDDQNHNASAVTRDYVLKIDEYGGNAPFLSIYGGKITTSRKLAEHALEKLRPYFDKMNSPWTSSSALPGGDIVDSDFDSFLNEQIRTYPDIPPNLIHHLCRAYGTRMTELLNLSSNKLGQMFGEILSEAEVNYLIHKEWAVTADDILWRRTKIGLRLPGTDRTKLEEWILNKDDEMNISKGR